MQDETDGELNGGEVVVLKGSGKEARGSLGLVGSGLGLSLRLSFRLSSGFRFDLRLGYVYFRVDGVVDDHCF